MHGWPLSATFSRIRTSRYRVSGAALLVAATAIFDLKTGKTGLTAARIRQIQRHIPANMRNIPIEELRIR